jgi:SAM-dependent methyltransferase
MTEHTPLTYDDLNWDELWRQARAQKSRGGKGAEDWDKKAVTFSSRNQSSPFVSQVLSRLPLDSSLTVLDIGSGPGTLALPIAPRVKAVTALDFSPVMLATLDDLASQAGIENIRTVRCSWEDDWSAFAIDRHDIAIASRSLGVDDLRGALQRLDRFASRSVYIVDRISPTPFDPEAFAAIGRPFSSGPDYIYTLNILYTMGIHPHVDILRLDRDSRYADLDDAVRSYTWMFKELTAEEESLLRRYLETNSRPCDDGQILLHRQVPAQWALIWWEKAPQP